MKLITNIWEKSGLITLGNIITVAIVSVVVWVFGGDISITNFFESLTMISATIYIVSGVILIIMLLLDKEIEE